MTSTRRAKRLLPPLDAVKILGSTKQQVFPGDGWRGVEPFIQNIGGPKALTTFATNLIAGGSSTANPIIWQRNGYRHFTSAIYDAGRVSLYQ